jgi:UDP-N-acetylglucosamine 1-carboxyvinyltransferase
VIGKRPVEDHIRGLQAFGYVYTATEDTMEFSGETTSADVHISAGFSVTATENILLIAAYREGHTIIDQCAIEPHVVNLIDVLRTNGVDIVVNYDHSICIK